MAVDLSRPLPKRLPAGGQAMLRLLQGNILKGHGRQVTAHVFLQFDPARAAEARAFLRKLGRQLTNADQQHAQARKVRAARRAAEPPPVTPPFVGCLLSHDGYRALGVPGRSIPRNAAFRAGLKARGRLLGDPPPHQWEALYRSEIHAMVLFGGIPDPGRPGSSRQVASALTAMTARLPGRAVRVVGVEQGRSYFNGRHDGIEHFGYVDGRSQPLFRESDIEREMVRTDGAARWDPAFPLKQVLVRDPGVNDPKAFGSYFVFRKLEQNVRAFRVAEAALSRRLRRLNPMMDPELAGAMLVGRFEDGTPVALQQGDGMHHPVPNDFDFAGDPAGLKCPFHAHIRKVNPRGDTYRLRGASLTAERAHLMARRGITYGPRRQNRAGLFVDHPHRGVGLLFMAFQADLARQFEFTQQAWANAGDFLWPRTGIDPLIGQGRGVAQTHRADWGNEAARRVKQRLADFVTLKGGEYFFAPSIGFLTSL